ncbi:MAG TPA: MotA/TolQ/ExbB proton channel family protein [Melioribacteraceae bacterium]|nr:MotA/TolQ/ExbB proton channel family protein [Melioribacteraceae bacterium]
MKNIAIETLLGIILGFGLFFLSIAFSTDNFLMFFNLPSLLMVVGGTLAATMISFRGRYVMQALKELKGIFTPQNINPQTLYKEVENIINLARVLKTKGIVELENELQKSDIKDPFVKYGGELLVTGYKGDELRKMLNNFVETSFERSMVFSHILRTMASFAPGFGMLGTVIGLIIMLDKMGSNPSELGRGLAFALITTLYGVLLAQLILRPAAEKVKQKQEILRFRNLLITEGFVLLGENQDSMLIQDMLNSFLDPENHFSVIKKDRN